MNGITQIQKTTNYDKFNILSGNRPIYRGHLNRLTDAIREENLLAFNPIIVNEKMEVIDGQHRLKAAQKLKTDVYYIVLPAGNLSEVQLLNTNNRNWTTVEFLDSYCKRGFADYKVLRQFAEDHDFTIPTALMMLSGGFRKGKWRHEKTLEFKTGDFKVVDKAKAEVFARLVELMLPYLEDLVKNDRDFYVALEKTLTVVTSEQLFAKLKESGWKIDRQVNAKGYLHRIEDILNFNAKKNHTRLF